ncbi:YbaB/EbfC family nucleoid-associated protein [Nocardioides panacisoli]|uniref:YbaB/EbfC family nucleoid-associated protein n=1 Tax=Nocardioides panacisoli TaxID=627624 RepID=UPI001C632854|nr:YbaB/EbfC family nucleoid-associated protein [Nocardioides panacisoli]QYJ03683.1 YbaB/EbfC family nucleoid-associated protein [Nocardioides panacisoli]
MSENPFDALGGGGGLDINALMQQAQQMQEGLQAAQAELEEATVDGTVAGGAVTVTVSGVGELKNVAIQPGQVDGSDAESLADLSDLIVAAYRDARAKADTMAAEKMGPLAGGGMPGLPGEGGGSSGPLGFQ